MKLIFSTILVVSLLGCAPKSQTESQKTESRLASVAMDKTEGCLEGPIEQFGRYIGDWDIRTWSLNQTDGKTWDESSGARWNFTCFGNGVAVQDFWMPDSGNVGTNLRMYDPNEKRWDVAWTASNLPGFTHIRAQEDASGNIVMHYVSPPQTPPRRITFMPPTQEGWDWKLEVEYASGEDKLWREVFRIKATQRQD